MFVFFALIKEKKYLDENNYVNMKITLKTSDSKNGLLKKVGMQIILYKLKHEEPFQAHQNVVPFYYLVWFYLSLNKTLDFSSFLFSRYILFTDIKTAAHFFPFDL